MKVALSTINQSKPTLIGSNSVRRFLIAFFNCIVLGDAVIKGVCPNNTDLTLSHEYAYHRPGPGFPTTYVVLSCVQWFEVRVSCWYWWNCWSSLFKYCFHNNIIGLMYLPYCTNNINCVINVREHRRGQSKMDNPEKMAT